MILSSHMNLGKDCKFGNKKKISKAVFNSMNSNVQNRDLTPMYTLI